MSLPSCQTFGITVKPYNPANDTHGVPPFYMMAFVVGGTPQTTLLGTNETDLHWTVDQPVDSQLMLSVVDSQGSAGGIPPRLYTVVTGQSTSCITTPPNLPPFTVKANVTDTLTTCEPWGLTISGGVPPYNLTLAALDSPIVTNVTMGPNDDAFTYIDRADPNTQLLAAISDLTGRFATGTPIVKTAGSSNVSCVGLVSSSGNATQIKQAEEAAASAKKHRSTVIGVCVTLALLLLFGGLAALFWYLRKQNARRIAELTPSKFEEVHDAEGQALSINAYNLPSPGNPRSPKSPVYSSTTLSPSNSVGSGAPFDNRRFVTNPSESADERPSSGRSQGFAKFPITPAAWRSQKALEAGLASARSFETSNPSRPDSSQSDTSSRGLIARSQSALPRSPAAGRGPGRSLSLQENAPAGALSEPEFIFQHRDGGVVRELPPPYADRSDRSTAVSNPTDSQN